jgi:radical SAM protein (TIGR01212 family)
MKKNRYFSFSTYLKKRFGCRVYRVPLDAGFTCPTRDGTLSRGGCLYCDSRGSASAMIDRRLPVHEQLLRGIETMRRRYGAEKFIAYFQAFTNTYSPPEKLERLYLEGISHKDVVGIAVGTRPDCVPEEILDLIASYTEHYDTWLEYGLQSAHDSTLKLINRGHTVSQFSNAVERTKRRGIKVCAHVIIGLPGETREMIMDTARFVGSLAADAVKIHLFHVLKGSLFEQSYRQGELKILSRDEYVSLVCDFLELLPASVLIQRLTGEAPRKNHVAPQWALDKNAVLRAISTELEHRDSWQGKRLSAERPGLKG